MIPFLCSTTTHCYAANDGYGVRRSNSDCSVVRPLQQALIAVVTKMAMNCCCSNEDPKLLFCVCIAAQFSILGAMGLIK
jgi:hypothetical protein